jgi:hemoglobin-like flavoprotein
MNMDKKDIKLVQESLPLIRENFAPASASFYNNLFSLRPDMRELFRDDLEGQGMRFLKAMGTIAELLDDPDALDAGFSQLAMSHAQLGVRAKHFEPMGSALMVTLGEALGSDFTDELQKAWRAAFDAVAGEMVERGGFS